MVAAPISLSSDNLERIRHFLDIAANCVDECAEHQAERQDVFLWNARRAAEAVLYALAEGTDVGTQLHRQNKDRKPVNLQDIAHQLVEKGRLHPQVEPFIDVMRSAGNLGAHAQSPEGIVDRQALNSCAVAIRQVMRWLYEASDLKRAVPEKVRLALEDLDERTPPRKSKYRQAMNELKDLRERHGRITEERDELLSLLKRYQQAHQGRGRAGVRITVVVVLVLLIGAAAGAGVLFKKEWLNGLLEGGVEQSTSTGAMVPQAPRAESPVVAPKPLAPPSPPTVASAPALRPAEEPPVLVAAACPAGTLEIPETKLALTSGPSPRPKWPKPEKVPPELPVPRFCIDSGPVLVAEFSAQAGPGLLESWSHAPPLSNFKLRGTQKMPMNFVTWQDADSYCRAKGGRLPTVVEWEAAVRRHPPVELTTRTGEWADDAFPTATFGYAARQLNPSQDPARRDGLYRDGLVPRPLPNGPKLSWNRRRADKGPLPTLSFRCAFTPGGAAPGNAGPTATP
jgi:hypothetical protein